VINTQEVPQHVWDSLSKPLIPIIIEFYKDPENQRNFEEWHYRKYGCYPTKASYMKGDKQPVD
jgi:hypothetical protein